MELDSQKQLSVVEQKSLRQMLHSYYSVPAAKVFPKFKMGVVIFFWGLVLIYSANQLLEPSLAQEIVTLVGLLLIGGGFLYAMAAQVRMLIGRFVVEFNKKSTFD